MKKNTSILFPFFLFVLLIFPVGNHLYSQEYPAIPEIKESHLRADLYLLASRAFEGREAGTSGAKSAGAFLASRLWRNNLLPLNGNEAPDSLERFYQNFEILGVGQDEIDCRLALSEESSAAPGEYGTDYYYFMNSPAELDLKSETVFAGYAIQAPEYNYDDFAGRDLQGKIVVAYYGEPLENDSTVFFNGKHQTQYALDGWKAQAVAERGGRALILLPTPENSGKYSRIIQRKSGKKERKSFVLVDETAVPVIYLSAEFAEKNFGAWISNNFQAENRKLKKWLRKKNKKTFGWDSKDWTSGAAELNLHYRQKEVRQCRNVLAFYRGSDPELSGEYILIGSHFDHEGMQGGEIFRGADDNASGVSANLNFAESLISLKEQEKPKRSILFAFWDAEEMGMLGSKYFASHPPLPMKDIKLVFNMDMIGRDASFNFAALRKPIQEPDTENKVMIFYSAQAPALRDMAEQSNDEMHLNLLFDPNVFFTSGSDHAVFQEQRIPVVYYFTGFHTDYSNPGDTPQKIDFAKLTRITRHIANFAYRLANLRELPVFDRKILTAPEGDFRM
ncbi:MAG: M28 family peptidase [Calditrichia bacterium]